MLGMSYLTYYAPRGGPESDKPLAWLHGEIKTPPFSREARIEAGILLRRLQQGESLGLPHSRPMPSIGRGCHELRVTDRGHEWRIVYRVDGDVIVIETPRNAVERCRKRLEAYDHALREGKKR